MSGMAPEDFLEVELPQDFGEGAVRDLLDRVFPAGEEERREFAAGFDLRANPDLPEIYAVFLAVCEEWRDSRCALLVSTEEGEEVDLQVTLPALIQPGDRLPTLSLHLEQRYCPLEYAVRQGFWGTRCELLDWMRSLTVLYFLDKHEVTPPQGAGTAPALSRALEDLQSRGIVAPQESDADQGRDGMPGETDGLSITAEGRGYIGTLLTETESYVEQFDHYQDTLADPDRDTVEFGTGRGVDLRVEAFLAEGLDPVRTVFLLRLYDGTLDARLRDWVDVMESEEFFEGVLEPAVNRFSADASTIESVLDEGYAWLEERRERERRDATDRELQRRARSGDQ